jgi:hypothetical protein
MVAAVPCTPARPTSLWIRSCTYALVDLLWCALARSVSRPSPAPSVRRAKLPLLVLRALEIFFSTARLCSPSRPYSSMAASSLCCLFRRAPSSQPKSPSCRAPAMAHLCSFSSSLCITELPCRTLAFPSQAARPWPELPSTRPLSACSSALAASSHAVLHLLAPVPRVASFSMAGARPCARIQSCACVPLPLRSELHLRASSTAPWCRVRALARHPAVLPCACESPCAQLASAPCSSTACPVSFVLSSSFSRLALAFIIDVVTSVVKICSAVVLYCASYPSRHPKSVTPYSNLANRILAGHRFLIRHGATPLLNPVSTPPWRSSSSSPSSTHPCVRSSSIGFRACSRLPSSRRTRHPLLNPTSPARSRHNLVIVPRVIKKSQESGEDEAHSVVFTKCANKSSSVILVYAKSPSRENTLVLATRHQLDKINPMGI